MKFKFRIMAGVFAATMLAATNYVGSDAQAQELRFFRIGTGSAGGTYFPIGGLIANAISNPPGSRPCNKGGNCGVPGLVAIAQSTNASAHNCTAVQAGQMEAGMTGASTLYQAYHGKGKFAGKPKPKIRVIAQLYPEDMHLVLPKGTTLKGIAALKGKRVGIGQAGSGTQITVNGILKEFGIGRSDIKAAELNNSQSSERLADGQLDAYFYTAGTPVAAMVQLSSTKGMALHSFSAEEVKRINKVMPFYTASTIKGGTYTGISKDTSTIAVNGILITHADQPEELIYEITKALWSKTSRKLFDTGHAKGKVIRMETALKGLSGLNVPLHPGAVKFYKEVGMIK